MITVITKKQKRLWGLIICILVVLGVCFAYNRATRDPWKVSEKWYCKEIDMSIHFVMDEKGDYNGDTWTQLTWNGETHEVGVDFQSEYILFLANIPNTDMLTIAMSGEWHYKWENMVINVGQNTIFGDEIETLTFVPVKRDAGTVRNH